MQQLNNVVNLSGMPVSTEPEAFYSHLNSQQISDMATKQIADLHFEVDWVHNYHSHMATLSDADGEAINMHTAILMRQFDQRVCALDSILCALKTKLKEGDGH